VPKEDIEIGESSEVRCTPHHTVVRKDKETVKVRIVHDCSAKSTFWYYQLIVYAKTLPVTIDMKMMFQILGQGNESIRTPSTGRIRLIARAKYYIISILFNGIKKAEKFKNLKTFACMDLGLGKLHRLQIIIVGSAAYWHLFVSLCAIMKLKMVWNLDNLVGFLNFIGQIQ
jgi:hypothetical protein